VSERERKRGTAIGRGRGTATETETGTDEVVTETGRERDRDIGTGTDGSVTGPAPPQAATATGVEIVVDATTRPTAVAAAAVRIEIAGERMDQGMLMGGEPRAVAPPSRTGTRSEVGRGWRTGGGKVIHPAMEREAARHLHRPSGSAVRANGTTHRRKAPRPLPPASLSSSACKWPSSRP